MAKTTQFANWTNLMAQAQQGNTTSYRQLLKEVADYTAKYLNKKMAGRPEVEDVTQETLLTIHKARHTFDPNRTFRPWLHAIIESRLIDFWRKQKRKEQFEVGSDNDNILSVAAPQEIAKLNVEELNKALLSLSQIQRAVIVSLKIEGLSIREASKYFDMTESAIKVTAHRGYKRLLEELNGPANP